MRVAFLIRKMVVLAVHGYPFARLNSGEQGKLQVHDGAYAGVQFQTAVRQAAMQVNGGKEDGKLQNEQRNQDHPAGRHVFRLAAKSAGSL
jgi:hypothetical protein